MSTLLSIEKAGERIANMKASGLTYADFRAVRLSLVVRLCTPGLRPDAGN